MPDIKLWGFSGSTYVRTIRMLLAEKGVTEYEQVPVDVLKGEPKLPEHLERHAFGKVPVVDIDGLRLIETPAIAAYLDAVLPGPELTPTAPADLARMITVQSIVDSYGYGALLAQVAGYHLFPDFIGGKDDAAHKGGIETGHLVMRELMRIRAGSPFLAGDKLSIADLYVAPVLAYVSMTPHADDFLKPPAVADWWQRITKLDSYTSTAP